MENEAPIRNLIDRWPSRKALADEIGASEANVHKWAQAGRIPSGWQYAVHIAAVARGFDDVTTDWLLAVHASPKVAS